MTSTSQNIRSRNISSSRKSDLWIAIIALVAALLFPLVDPGNYVLSQATLFFIWATVVTQWNLVFGIAGIITLGHMAVFAVGAYTTAMLGLYLGWSPWATLPFAAVAAVIASLLMGAATLRLRGPYIAVMTLAIAQAVYSLIMTDVECFSMVNGCQNLTGGARGLFNYGDFGFNKLLGFKYRTFGDYYLSLALLVVGMIVAFLITYSALGATFRALRDNRICAEARGVDRVYYQFVVFGAAGFCTGLAGAVYAGIQRTIGPDVLSIPLLLFILSMMIVGGRGTRWGPILGAATLMLADTVLRDFPEYRNAALALFILCAMIFLPRGVAGLVGDIAHWRPSDEPKELQSHRIPQATLKKQKKHGQELAGAASMAAPLQKGGAQ
uniref:branched-chain amino acid ABC transporter permease n=1 Tax=Aminobacter niigataensis TaxID=83265 RepID=UPI002852A0BD|nr:branched-chain amino acid ABC transporter permease [Aminobacter niigataensis]WMD00157.1 branched-chain amino acid ABC transporter permease [Aminobacter niigataensis]